MMSEPHRATEIARPPRARRRVVVDDSNVARVIGERLRRARLAASLTQSQLAAGRYTKAYVSALENGLSKPSMAALTYFADRLGLPASHFLDDVPATWRRLEVDLALASGQRQVAVDGYLELLDQSPGREIRAQLLNGLAEAYTGLDKGAEAARAAAEAAHIFASLGREPEAAAASYWLASAQYMQGNVTESESILLDLLAKVRGGLRVEPDFQVRLLMALSSTASKEGRHAVALAYLEEVRSLASSLDDHRRAAFLYDLSYSYRETGDLEAAIRTGISSLALFRATGFDLGIGALENDLALSYLALGNIDKAQELARSSAERFEMLGDRRWLAHVVETQAQISLARGDAAEAARLASSALAIAEEVANERAAVSSLRTLGRAQRTLGDVAAASASYELAVERARATASPGLVRAVLGEWADILAAAGEHERAFSLLREAMQAS
jgi:transcriptional regulator with XRE-family HTH domain